MNVYEKLNKARIQFQTMNVKKSGKNNYAGYTYYELADILPTVNKIADELKFTCSVSFGTEIAQLDFIDMEKPEDKISFTSPMSEASLKGCHMVQNLGAVQTYIKRYLYQNCFEIVEADALDSTMNPNEKAPANNPSTSSASASDLANLTATVQNYIKTGLLVGELATRAQEHISKHNIDGLKKTIQYAESLKK